jgi:hypothetical protein
VLTDKFNPKSCFDILFLHRLCFPFHLCRETSSLAAGDGASREVQEEGASMDQCQRALLALLRSWRPPRSRAACRHRSLVGLQHPLRVSRSDASWASGCCKDEEDGCCIPEKRTTAARREVTDIDYVRCRRREYP